MGSDNRKIKTSENSKGLGSLFNVIADMINNNISKKYYSGDLFEPNEDGGLKGKYAFSVKLGLNEKDVKQIALEPEVIIPQADVLKENDKILIILEMPGVAIEKVSCSIDDKTLCIEGVGDGVIYQKKIEVGENIPATSIIITEKNGTFEIII